MTDRRRQNATSFAPPAKVPDRVALEHEVLRRWEEGRVFEELRDRNRGAEPFSFVDGPITANNPMGVHHGWGRTLKDIVQRYWAMKGRDLRWQNGFDCQGLWVEVEVEKALGFNSKNEIEAAGLDVFAVACRDRVAQYAERITQQSKRLGMWMDWDRSYFTMSDTNISYIWTFLAECHRRGWLYRGHQLMPWCHRCGTSLSQHELVDSYAEVEHPSVFVKLPLEDSDECLLVWTTTPWTLPANAAAAVVPTGRYELIDSPEGRLWVACDRRAALGIEGEVLRRVTGAELAGRRYAAPFHELPAATSADHHVVVWDDVSLEEGTGIVHVAPGCGREDFALGRDRGLATLMPIDEAGFYSDDYGPLAGLHVDEANQVVLSMLEDRGVLCAAGTLVHRYPNCWRCSTPLVHRVVDEWFIACDEVRADMKSAAASVRWQPAHYGKRMADWLDNMGDWCISRKRYWGLPLPFFTCDAGHLTLVESKQDLFDRALTGTDDLQELHRPWIDDVTVACDQCGAPAQRVAEVGDCWLDAGIVPFSTLGWRNPTLRPGALGEGAAASLTRADLPDHEHWLRWFPAQVVCEMHEQIRLWFYSQLFMSVVLEGRAPYDAVLTYGKVNDETGREMHRSWGNAIWFDDAVDDMGADTMRWLYAKQPPARDLKFGPGPAQHASREFLTFWNTYAFFVTYANINDFQPSESLLEHGPKPNGLHPLDRWLLARTETLVTRCTQAMESLQIPAATVALEEFTDDLSNWYIRLSRDRFWSDDTPDATNQALQTLWFALVTATRCIAPIMPLVADHLWANLTSGCHGDVPASIHLFPYPAAHTGHADPGLVETMSDLRQVCELGRRLRSDADTRQRQPLPAMYITTSDATRRARLSEHTNLIAAECNVKAVHVEEQAGEFADLEVRPDFGRLGPRLREQLSEVAARLASGDYQRTADGFQVGKWHLDEEDVETRTRARLGYAMAEGNGWVVGFDTTLTPELLEEGRARDFLRALQQLRKDADLAVTQRIEATYTDAEADLIETFGDWIMSQALVVRWTLSDKVAISPTDR